MLKAVVIDDSAFMRRAIGQMIESEGDIKVVATAKNGREGLEAVKRHNPDVVTLDIEMPEMDGLTALGHIMREHPTPVIMVSSLTSSGSHATLKALKLGAVDFLTKDQSQLSLNITDLQAELLAKIRAVTRPGRSARTVRPAAAAKPQAASEIPTFRPGQFDLVCIGSSTGGPPLLERIIGSLPGDLTAAVVVCQHMPEVFTRSMSERLQEMSQLKVLHAEQGMGVRLGHVYVAPGSQNLHIVKQGLGRYAIEVNQKPEGTLYKPSVNAMLKSAGLAAGSRALGVVLTGIGDDGLAGGRVLVEKGGQIIAQSADSCVVYGMPKAVTENGLTIASLHPQAVAQALATLSRSGQKAGQAA